MLYQWVGISDSSSVNMTWSSLMRSLLRGGDGSDDRQHDHQHDEGKRDAQQQRESAEPGPLLPLEPDPAPRELVVGRRVERVDRLTLREVEVEGRLAVGPQPLAVDVECQCPGGTGKTFSPYDDGTG